MISSASSDSDSSEASNDAWASDDGPISSNNNNTNGDDEIDQNNNKNGYNHSGQVKKTTGGINIGSLLSSHMEASQILGGISSILGYIRDNSYDAELGEGANFEVVKQFTKIDGVPTAVAVKRLIPQAKTNAETADPELWRPMLRDMAVMARMKRCRHILDEYGNGCQDDPVRGPIPYQVVEWANGGTLREFLDIKQFDNHNELLQHVAFQYQRVDYGMRKSFLIEIVKGLQALHAENIMHTDLKLQNVLVFFKDASEYHAKLCDFGSAVIMDVESTEGEDLMRRAIAGTVAYSPPEYDDVFKSHTKLPSAAALRKLDIFSFALVTLELLSCSDIQGLPMLADYSLETITSKVKFLTDFVGAGELHDVYIPLLLDSLTQAESRCDNVEHLLRLVSEREGRIGLVTGDQKNLLPDEEEWLPLLDDILEEFTQKEPEVQYRFLFDHITNRFVPENQELDMQPLLQVRSLQIVLSGWAKILNHVY